MKYFNGLSSSQQCYLAEILSLEAEHGVVRQGELAERIGVNKSSVTGALRVLTELAFITYEPYGAVTLTPKGTRMAGTILARRRIISDYLVRFLDIREGAAHEAACRMQYSVPDAVMDRFSAKLGVDSEGLSRS